jgi:hypothetical protein
MKRPIESDYTSHVAYTRALEEYCDTLAQVLAVPPAWFPAVENILNEYGLQAIDFVADFKAAMKDAEQSQRTWVGSGDLEDSNAYQTPHAQPAPDCKQTGICVASGLACFGQPAQEPVALEMDGKQLTLGEALEEAIAATERSGSRRLNAVLVAAKNALYATPPAAPVQEPVGTVQCMNGVTIGYLEIMQPVGTKLYTTLPAQPAQEPVQWNPKDHYDDGWRDAMNSIAAQPAPDKEPRHIVQSNGRHSPLLTHMMNSRTTPTAAQRQWVGLKDPDFSGKPNTPDFIAGAFFAEAKLKEKNT